MEENLHIYLYNTKKQKKDMKRIKSKTTFYRSDVGTVQRGDIVKVPNRVAKSLVKEKGYAEYADDLEEVDEDQELYPEDFLDKDIPEKFPHGDRLREQDINTFRKLVNVEDVSNIKNIGDERKQEINDGLKLALNSYLEK